MDIHALQLTLRDFAAARSWQPFHTPKNLSTALMVETAELAEIFQWMTSEESQAAHLYPAMKERIADEVADVLLYLLQLADHCAIDMPSAVANKLVKNAVKYPAVNPSRKRAKASESAIPVATTVVAEPVRSAVDAQAGQSAAQTHVLVDWENVQPKDQDIQTLVPPVTDVWLFHGPSQKNVSADQALFGQRATLVPIARAGKNALDFHLSFYMGYIASRSPQANFVVISNDKGYLPMLEHAQSLGFSARQIGFVKAHAAVKKVAPGKTRAKAPTIGLSAIAKESSAKTAPLTRQQKVHAPMAAKRPAAVKTAPLTPRVTQASSKKAVQTAEPAPVKKTAPVKKAPAARKTQASGAATPAPAKRSNQRQRPASQVPKARNIAGIAEFLTARRIAAPPPEAHAPEIRKQPSLTFDLDKAVRHVQASLQRSANKPTRKARLLAAVTSLLNESSSDAAIVTDVLAKLVSRGFVRLDEKGGVHFNP